MLSRALESLVSSSQILVSIMLSTNPRRMQDTLVASDASHHYQQFNYSTVDNSTMPTLETAQEPLSPFNKDVAFPEDIYSLVLWGFAWALLHALVLRLVLVPLSFRVVLTPQLDVSKAASRGGQAYLAKHKEAVVKAERDRVKFQTASWRAILYGVSTVLGVYICTQEREWAFDSKLYFVGYPHKTTFWLKFYYNVGFGNYAYQLFNVFFERRQSDFVQMVVHHVATVVVMFLSYILGFTRAGVMILLLHDCTDPIMELAKSCLYAGQKVAADICFGIFALSFLITRDYLFPVYIVMPLMTYSKYEDGEQMPRGYGHYFYPIAACLYVLQALNVFWGYLILKMVAKVLASGEAPKGDIRDEGCDEE